jgi:hypothetical protein
MKQDFAELTKAHNLLERQRNNLAYSYHYRRLELIKVADQIGLDLTESKKLEEDD